MSEVARVIAAPCAIILAEQHLALPLQVLGSAQKREAEGKQIPRTSQALGAQNSMTSSLDSPRLRRLGSLPSHASCLSSFRGQTHVDKPNGLRQTLAKWPLQRPDVLHCKSSRVHRKHVHICDHKRRDMGRATLPEVERAHLAWSLHRRRQPSTPKKQGETERMCVISARCRMHVNERREDASRRSSVASKSSRPNRSSSHRQLRNTAYCRIPSRMCTSACRGAIFKAFVLPCCSCPHRHLINMTSLKQTKETDRHAVVSHSK